MVDLNLPYAYILGNHDAQANFNRSQIMKLDMSNHNSFSGMSNGISGASNYWFPIYSRYNSSKQSVRVWGFDTGNEGCLSYKDGWGCIEPDQIVWYTKLSQQILDEYGKEEFGLGFYHIPLFEYINLYNNYPTYDWKREDISCPNQDSDFFGNVSKIGNINAMFCGHDHNNDFGGFVNGIEIGFGRKTGFGSYGPDIQSGEYRGGRVFELIEHLNGTVTMNHQILDQNGKWIPNTPIKVRNDKQLSCQFTSKDYFEFKRKIMKIKY